VKPLPTFFVSVKLWLHSDVCIWAPSSWSQRTLRVAWGPSGTSVKQQGSHELIWGTKGLSFKAKVHWDHEVSNPITINHSNLVFKVAEM
jgi:hypothetical protein